MTSQIFVVGGISKSKQLMPNQFQLSQFVKKLLYFLFSIQIVNSSIL